MAFLFLVLAVRLDSADPARSKVPMLLLPYAFVVGFDQRLYQQVQVSGA